MKKKLYRSDGIKTASPADCLEKKDMEKLKKYFSSLDLTKKTNLRNMAILNFNLNVGLRAGDLLALPQSLIIQNGKVVDMFALYEQKTNKKRIIYLNNTAKNAIQSYYDACYDKLKNTPWLFPSRKKNQGTGHLNVSSFDGILKKAQKEAGINSALTISSHSARKYLGSALYDKGIPLEQIREMFGHTKSETTLVYISAIKRNSRKLYQEIDL